jgi:hypothetical protein
MEKTLRWVDWTVGRFSPKSENPLVKDEAIERIKAEFGTVRGHEAQWDAVVSELGKDQEGHYYLLLRNISQNQTFVCFTASLDKLSEKGLTIRVGDGVSANYYKQLNVGSKVKLKGRCEITFEDFKKNIIIIIYDCKIVETDST